MGDCGWVVVVLGAYEGAEGGVVVFVWGRDWHWGVRGGSRVEYGVAVKGAWIRAGDDAMTW